MSQTQAVRAAKSWEFSSLVAENISPSIKPGEVDELLEHSAALGLLFHGIKRLRNLDSIKKTGIEPLTPEGGHVSCWGAGSQLFWGAIPKRDDPMWTFNSVFFHYAQLVTTSDTTTFGLAITDREQLSTAGITPLGNSSDGECRIPEIVPADLLRIVTVEGMDLRTTRETLFHYMLESARHGVLSAPGIIQINCGVPLA